MNAQHVAKVIDAVVKNGAWKGTLYLSPKEVVRVTRKLYRGRKHWDAERPEFLVTVGRPNYLERDRVKELKQAGEAFPVRKVQFKYHKARPAPAK